MSETVSACSADTSDGPCVSINRVAPRTPIRLRAGRQRETAGAVDAGRQHQRDARACRLVDGALQGAALVAGRAWTHAELRGVEPEGGQRHGFGRRGQCGGE